MIQNCRAYQLIDHKTHSRLLAWAIAQGASFCGYADLSLCALRSHTARLDGDAIAARAALETIWPRPATAGPCVPLPPVDPTVELSVIVPVYNGETTITACLDSILQQNADCRVQLIVVDSDSTDSTPALLQRYQNLPDVVLSSCTAPRSAAAARNEGLRHAVGRWIMFVDSDDLLLPGAIRTLLDAAKQQDADIVQGGWQYLFSDNTRGPVQTYAAAAYTGAAALDRFDLPGMPWGKVYRRELFDAIRFPAYYTCFEDSIIHFLVFRKAQRIASIPDTVYLWRKNPKGLTSTNQHRPAAIQSYWIMEELLEQDAALGLAHDDLYRCTLTLQLTAFCHNTIAGLSVEVQQEIFKACCALYAHALPGETGAGLPRRVRWGVKALQEQNFALWCRYGRRFQLL